MPKADSHQFLTEQAKALAEPLPTPPQKLDETALVYWPAVIGSKARTYWTPIDLIVACQLCRDMAAAQLLAAEIETDGAILVDRAGKKYPHPAGRLLDAASRRILAANKSLQINSLCTNGKAEQQVNKNTVARDLAEKIQAADSLIPRPLQ